MRITAGITETIGTMAETMVDKNKLLLPHDDATDDDNMRI